MPLCAWKTAALAATLLGFVAPACASAAVSADQAVAHLNAQRLANGIPADVVQSPSMSDGCDKHNNYMSLNKRFAHGEQPGMPGYTPEGAGIAPGSGGSGEVLSGASAWDDAWENPWANAPLHLMHLFNPRLQAAGYADSHGYACMRTIGFRQLPAGATYSLPGNAVTGVSPISRGESPYSAADLAGVKGVTGYNIILWHAGGSSDVASAKLTGPSGLAEVRVVDSRTPTPGGGSWNRGAAVLVPVRALDAGAPYTVDVTFTDGATHHSTFRTASRDPKLELRVFGGEDGVLTVYAPALADLTAARVTGPGGEHPYIVDRDEPHRFQARGLPPGVYTACVQAGGPGTGYSPVALCGRAKVRVTQSVSVRAVKGGRLRVTVGKASIAPRRATLTLSTRSGRRLKVHRFRLVTRSFARPKGTAFFELVARPAGGYGPVSLAKRLR